MATVYLARDLKHDRLVALKVLHPELAASLGSERFLREIRLTARLDHPHILPLLDSGAANGFLYYVMPYVEGESLRDRLRRETQLPIEDCVRITSEIADALDYAHGHGVIHRDIKPENILLASGHARVADFGIARAIEAAGGDQLTGTGIAIGTPTYMSPEQATGEGRLDGRSDIYAVGCVLYEMLVGEPPFTGPTPQAVIAKRFHQPVTRVSLLRDGVPAHVEEALTRALARIPADRFSTAAHLNRALAPPRDTAPSPDHTRRESPRIRSVVRGRWLIAAVLLFVAIGGAVWAVSRGWSRLREVKVSAITEPDPRRIAVLYFDDLSRTRDLGYLADGLTEALIDELSGVRPLEVISRNGVLPYRNDSIPPDSIARVLNVGTLVAGSVEEAGGRLRTTVRLVDGASGADFRRASFGTPTKNPLAALDTITQEIARFLRARLGEEVRLRRQHLTTSDPDAWALVQRSELHRKRADSSAALGDTARASREISVADSLLVRSEALDPRWAEPVILRAAIAYRQSRLRGPDPEFARPWIEKGLGHVTRAIARDPRSADALELRGTLLYWKWLLSLERNPLAAKRLLASAQEDLEAATQINPMQAGAWSALSHLYYQTSGATAAKLAALRAYEADAYLSAADQILWRLFTSSYDLQQFAEADRWCQEGQRRFPANSGFVECQLWMLITTGKAPDVGKAWDLVGRAEHLVPAGKWPFEQRKMHIFTAAVLARAGHSDSARQVLSRARTDSTTDPTRELPYYEALAYAFLGDRTAGLASLSNYVAKEPDKRRAEIAADTAWFLRSLRQDPRFEQLFGRR
jgi:TolB-like protein